MKYFMIFLTLLACVACNIVEQGDEARNTGTDENGLLQTGNDNVKTNDDLLVEAREEVNVNDEQDPLHPTTAERLVREKLRLQDDENTIVQYDHLEEGNYIIHVYSIDGNRENSEAWFMVDLETKKVEQLKR